MHRYLQESKGSDQTSEKSGDIASLWGFIFGYKSVANSVVRGLIWQKFELVRDCMHVLIICKYKQYRIKTRKNGDNVFPIITLSVAMET